MPKRQIQKLTVWVQNQGRSTHFLGRTIHQDRVYQDGVGPQSLRLQTSDKLGPTPMKRQGLKSTVPKKQSPQMRGHEATLRQEGDKTILLPRFQPNCLLRESSQGQQIVY